MKNQTTIEPLMTLIERLRDPIDGCSWDLAQTQKSLMPMTQDELYELFDAILSDNTQEICEELGDILFHLAFYAQIAKENGQFDMQAVIDQVVEKMTNRHPHIFAGKTYANREEQKADWHAIKAKEKAKKTPVLESLMALTNSDGKAALTTDIFGQASIAQSLQAQSLMAELGFDWPDAEGVFEKITEECDELQQAVGSQSESDILDEYGDLLFAVINLGRKLSVSPDMALRQATHKFLKRSNAMLTDAQSIEAFRALSLEEKEACWQAAKRQEKQQ